MSDSCNLPARGGHRPRHARIHHHRHRYPKLFNPCVCASLSFSPASRSLPILYSNWPNPQFTWNSARTESGVDLSMAKTATGRSQGEQRNTNLPSPWLRRPPPLAILTALQTNLQSTLNKFEVHLVFSFLLC